MAAATASERPRARKRLNDHVDNSPGFVSAMRSTAYDDDNESDHDDYYANSYSLSLRSRNHPKSPTTKKKPKSKHSRVTFEPPLEPESEPEPERQAEPIISPDRTDDEEDAANLGETSASAARAARKDRPKNNSFVTYNAFDPPAGISPEPTGAEDSEPNEPAEVLQTPSPAEQSQDEPIDVVELANPHLPPGVVDWSTINDPTDPSKTPAPDGISQEQWHVALKIRHNKSVAWSDYTPELLRAALPTQDAINEFLASRWIPIKELHRLESFGVFTYKRGKFTDAEKRSLRMYLEDFQEVHGLSDAELVDLLMSKGKNTEKNRYGKFWPELAGAVPGRPVRYVKEVVKRMYDPRGRKGEWTMEEDYKLKK